MSTRHESWTMDTDGDSSVLPTKPSSEVLLKLYFSSHYDSSGGEI